MDEETDKGDEEGNTTYEINHEEKKRDPNTIATILQNFETSREKMKEQYYNQSRQFSFPPLFTQWKQHFQNVVECVRSKVQ